MRIVSTKAANKMILGVGIDIIETERVAEKIAKENGFREYVFSKAEINYCESKVNKAEHYAVRFAAKEALLKAMGTGISADFTLKEIEISHDKLGKPSFSFSGKTEMIIKTKGISKIHVSLSHQKSMACASVVIEK